MLETPYQLFAVQGLISRGVRAFPDTTPTVLRTLVTISEVMTDYSKVTTFFQNVCISFKLY